MQPQLSFWRILMTEVFRICPNCGEQSQLKATFCPQCGIDVVSGLPEPKQRALPISTATALMPLAAGAAGFLLRVGWKLLQSRMLGNVTYLTSGQGASGQMVQKSEGINPKPTIVNSSPNDLPLKAKCTIRIQSRWAVGDESGIKRQGQSEHIIEIDD